MGSAIILMAYKAFALAHAIKMMALPKPTCANKSVRALAQVHGPLIFDRQKNSDYNSRNSINLDCYLTFLN